VVYYCVLLYFCVPPVVGNPLTVNRMQAAPPPDIESDPVSAELYKLASYQYHLPEELIAQKPCSPRDASRLMVIDRAKETITHHSFRDLPQFLHAGDTLIFNDTRVIPARLVGRRTTGGKAEIFLLRNLGADLWEALAKPAKKLLEGTSVTFGDALTATVVAAHDHGVRIVKLASNGPLADALDKVGQMPLPPYILREAGADDRQDYQTVFARRSGAVAAPTAGLHFTEELLEGLRGVGIGRALVTLHVGLGTFRPVQVEDIRDHKIHTEWYEVTGDAAEAINAVKAPGRRICVGTTSLRTVETAAGEGGEVLVGSADTEIFIYPGYRFKVADALLTNFHLPGSSLLMLVAALGGYDLIMEAYRQAVQQRYRFFSYGDAMLLI